jgi:glycosyltransferase involved in cell wall biosynthesis
MTAYMEISALFEPQWTGIPMVVASLAEQALADPSVDWKFINETVILSRSMVETILAERSGASARRIFQDEMWTHRHVSYDDAACSKAVFTNIKPMRGLFGQEAMIIYDLSPMLTPQFHNSDTINHFSNRFRSDIETSNHFFPISEASRDDIETYFGVPRSSSTIIRMGVDMDPMSLSMAQEIARSASVEPYVVVLGTLEPRKNGRLVMEYIARNPGFAHRYKVVFIGRGGWLGEREELIAQTGRSGVPRDQIVFTGYVTEQEKIGLLYNAAFCIYASYFEGFGLPILEAGVLGKLIVCSNTSSMPEVMPDQCLFFDPSSVLELARAIGYAEKRSKQMRPALALPEIAERLTQHSWRLCYEGVQEWVKTP